MGAAPLLVMLAAVGVDYGWQPDGTTSPRGDNLEYIIQISPEQWDETAELGEITSTIDPEIAGRVSRIVVRIGDQPLARDPGRRADDGVVQANGTAELVDTAEDHHEVPIPEIPSIDALAASDAPTAATARMKPDPQSSGFGMPSSGAVGTNPAVSTAPAGESRDNRWAEIRSQGGARESSESASSDTRSDAGDQLDPLGRPLASGSEASRSQPTQPRETAPSESGDARRAADSRQPAATGIGTTPTFGSLPGSVPGQGTTAADGGRVAGQQGNTDRSGQNSSSFVRDAAGNLLDRLGRPVDQFGRLIDGDSGRLIDAAGNWIDEQGRQLDSSGRPMAGQNGQAPPGDLAGQGGAALQNPQFTGQVPQGQAGQWSTGLQSPTAGGSAAAGQFAGGYHGAGQTAVSAPPAATGQAGNATSPPPNSAAADDRRYDDRRDLRSSRDDDRYADAGSRRVSRWDDDRPRRDDRRRSRWDDDRRDSRWDDEQEEERRSRQADQQRVAKAEAGDAPQTAAAPAATANDQRTVKVQPLFYFLLLMSLVLNAYLFFETGNLRRKFRSVIAGVRSNKVSAQPSSI